MKFDFWFSHPQGLLADPKQEISHFITSLDQYLSRNPEKTKQKYRFTFTFDLLKLYVDGHRD